MTESLEDITLLRSFSYCDGLTKQDTGHRRITIENTTQTTAKHYFFILLLENSIAMRIVSFILVALLSGVTINAQDNNAQDNAQQANNNNNCGVTCAQKALAAKSGITNSEGNALRSKLATLGGQVGSAKAEAQACSAELQQAGKGESVEGNVKMLEGDVTQLKQRVTQVQQLEAEIAATKEQTAKLVTAEQDFRQNRLPQVADFRKKREEVQSLLKEKQKEGAALKEAIKIEKDTPAPYVNVDGIQQAVMDLVGSLTGKK